MLLLGIFQSNRDKSRARISCRNSRKEHKTLPRGSLFSTRLMGLEAGWSELRDVTPCIPSSRSFDSARLRSPSDIGVRERETVGPTRKNISYWRTRGYAVALTYRTYDFSTILLYFLYDSHGVILSDVWFPSNATRDSFIWLEYISRNPVFLNEIVNPFAAADFDT